jgi:branched-chain amino acid transport system ATP-binding protein
VAQLFPKLTVLENVMVSLVAAEGAQPSFFRPLDTQQRRQRADAIFAEFGVGRYRDALVSTVPQGVRKLVDIAMALVSRPRMLLLDEPTSGVSSEEKFGLMDTVMAVVRQHGVTVLFVEHDMEIVARYVTRIIAFDSGEIIADGPPRSVLGDARVREFVVGNRLDAAAVAGEAA